MSRTERGIALVLVVLSALVQGCGHPSAPSAAGCSSDEQCSADARCRSHVCVANQPPVADFSVSGDLRASAIVTLDGSPSRDPDAGDAVASYAWTIRSDGAPCPAPAVASTDRTVQVRFGCAGRFQVQLVVADGKHVQGTPAARAVDIQARVGAALVDAGSDQAVDHGCAGTPLTCTTRAPVQLSATVVAGTSASFHWSVQPPAGRELDAQRRVTFLPSADAQSPTVELETDGTAISGDWLFWVEIRDGVCVLDADVTRVSVRNHAPEIRGGPPGSFDHVYVGENQLFTASGSFPVEVVDEDGDPLTRQVAFHHAGDGGAAFQGEDLGTAVRFSVMVPRTTPADALFVAGAAGLERSVALTATDLNGGTASATYPVTIGNRPPLRVRQPAGTSPHRYAPTARQYLADADLGQWNDPDGDPLDFAVTADSGCPVFAVDTSGTAWLRCVQDFTSIGSLPAFLRSRSAVVAVSDPWTTVARTAVFQIGNRAPVAGAGVFQPAVACKLGGVFGLCPSGGTYYTPGNLFPAATVYPPSGASDPDGDPVEVLPSAGGFGGQCQPGDTCKLTIFLPESQSCALSPPDLKVPYTVSDGVASAAGSVLVDPHCH